MIRLTSSPSKTAGREFWVAREGGLIVGNLYTIIRKDGRVFVNIVMNKPDRDKGFGTEALKLFMKQTGHRKVYAETRKGNVAMRKVFEKLKWKEVPGQYQALYVWNKT